MNLVAMRCSFSEDNWARANLTVESVCASAMRIYKDPSDGVYRVWCSCCKGHISSSVSLQFHFLCDALEEIPYASIFHRIIWVIGSSEGNQWMQKSSIALTGSFLTIFCQMQSLKLSHVCPVQWNMTTVLGMTNF